MSFFAVFFNNSRTIDPRTFWLVPSLSKMVFASFWVFFELRKNHLGYRQAPETQNYLGKWTKNKFFCRYLEITKKTVDRRTL